MCIHVLSRVCVGYQYDVIITHVFAIFYNIVLYIYPPFFWTMGYPKFCAKETLALAFDGVRRVWHAQGRMWDSPHHGIYVGYPLVN